MEILITILKSVGMWLVLSFFSTILLGYVVRGLFVNPEWQRLKSEGSDFVKGEIKKFDRADWFVNILGIVGNIAYFWVLIRYWGFGFAAVALLLMIARLPDLLWEIRHGRKLDPKLLPLNFTYYATTAIQFGSLLLLYYFLR